MNPGKNVAASVKQRLLNMARERGEEFNLLLNRYGVERLLYRLSRSEHASEFVLKGAMLFLVWTEVAHRPTRDLDLLGFGPPELERLRAVFRGVCGVAAPEDGLEFPGESVRVERIRDDAEYAGVRVRLEGRLGSARLPLQVDVGFGDAVVPPPEPIEFPVLLDHAAPALKAYRPETMIAEKLQAMVELGIANSRMKDFFDIRFLAANFPFDGAHLARAVRAAFERRDTSIPAECPIALSPAFAEDAAKATQWRAFLRRSRLLPEGLALEAVVRELRGFLLPVLGAIARDDDFEHRWPTGGPWEPISI